MLILGFAFFDTKYVTTIAVLFLGAGLTCKRLFTTDSEIPTDGKGNTLTSTAVSSITKIEGIIGRDEGGRGIRNLIVDGDLMNAALTLARL